LFHVGLLACRKGILPYIVCQVLLYFPFIGLIKNKYTYTGMLIW